MLIDGKHQVDIFDRNVGEIVDEVFRIHPTPDSLCTAQLSFSKEEDCAFDALQGMMWPCLFTEGLKERYRKHNLKVKTIGASVSFADNLMQLSFTVY